MGVSKNRGTPKSSILIGGSIINHPFLGRFSPYFWKHPDDVNVCFPWSFGGTWLQRIMNCHPKSSWSQEIGVPHDETMQACKKAWIWSFGVFVHGSFLFLLHHFWVVRWFQVHGLSVWEFKKPPWLKIWAPFWWLCSRYWWFHFVSSVFLLKSFDYMTYLFLSIDATSKPKTSTASWQETSSTIFENMFCLL